MMAVKSGNFGGYSWIGENADGRCNGIKYGLNISSAEWKKVINIYEFTITS
jgi:hypothetical protein